MTLAEKKHWDFACKFGPSASAEVSRGWLRTESTNRRTLRWRSESRGSGYVKMLAFLFMKQDIYKIYQLIF